MENASSLSQPYGAVPPRESAISAVSWAAVFAGAVIAAALIRAPIVEPVQEADSVACKPHCDLTGPAVQPNPIAD